MAQPNGLNPEFSRISVGATRSGGTNGLPVITASTYGNSASIIAEIGYLPNGSLVINSTGASGQVFCMQGSVYTPLAIP